MRRIELEDRPRRQVRALCYIVDRSHVQYAGRLTLAESLHHVRQGHGRSGPNRDYVLETVRALEELGYRESELHLLAERLAARSGRRRSGIRDQIADAHCSLLMRSPVADDRFRDQARRRLLDAVLKARQEGSRSRPGAIGSSISTTMVPGGRSSERRGQKRPELSAIGTQGTPALL